MVSTQTPGAPAERAGWQSVLDARLREYIEQTRSEFYEPWRSRLDGSPDLQAEIDRTVQALRVFFNKWVVEIIVVLGQRGTVRFTELKRSLEGISGRTLSQRLQDLEAQGLVHRELYDEMPVRVEYSLTERGQDVAQLALPVVLYLSRRSRPPKDAPPP